MELSLEMEQDLWNQTGIFIRQTINNHLEGIEKEYGKRAYKVANQTRNELIKVMQGTRSGRVYKVPGTHGNNGGRASGVEYTASAPGEVPAIRTGGLRSSYGAKLSMSRSGNNLTLESGVESGYRSGNYLIGELLENGTKNMDPRPFKEQVIDKVTPYAQRIYSAPYYG